MGRGFGQGAVLLAFLALVGSTYAMAGSTDAAYSSMTRSDGSSLGARACYPAQAWDSPVFLYSYNEDSGSGVEDASGNGNDGVLQGTAARTTGTCSSTRAGGYLHLDGQSTDGGGNASMVVTPVSADNPGTFSVETWFRTTSNNKGLLIGFNSEQTATKSPHYDRMLFFASSGWLRFGVCSCGTVDQVQSQGPLNDGAWHDAVGVFSTTSGVELWVDGVLQNSNSGFTTAENFAGWWRIGQGSESSWDDYYDRGEPFTGDLDDTALYYSRLTSTQIAAHYAAGR